MAGTTVATVLRQRCRSGVDQECGVWSVESPSLDYRPYLSTTVGVCSPEDGGTAVLANRSVVPSAVCLIPTSQGTTVVCRLIASLVLHSKLDRKACRPRSGGRCGQPEVPLGLEKLGSSVIDRYNAKVEPELHEPAFSSRRHVRRRVSQNCFNPECMPLSWH